MKNNKLLKLIIVVLIGLILFYGILLFWGSPLAGIIYRTIFYGKYSTTFIAEIVLLIFALLLIFIRKKGYIFKEKNEGFKAAIKRGMPLLVISIILFCYSLIDLLSANQLNFPNLLSLIFLCLAIGFAEELIFRGWLQNEILEKYGNTRKQVIICIIISGIIFGCAHVTNVFSGQDIITTLMQVLQSSAIGILLASAYYVSKNIWSVIFLHAFYDFAALLGEVNNFKDCIMSDDITVVALTITIIMSLIYAFIYLIGAYYNLQRTNINKLLNEEVTKEILDKDYENRKKANNLLVILIIALFGVSFVSPKDELLNRQICYEYEEIDISGKMNFFLNQDSFNIDNYKLSIKNNKLVIANELDSYDININDVEDFIVFNNNELYTIVINSIDGIYISNITINDINENIGDTFIKYEVPDIMAIGYLETENIKYPLLKTTISDYFIIKDNKAMVIKK